MLATYHNHSTWSDGKASIAQLVEAARASGIGELGISDHFVLHPSGKDPAWAMPSRQLGEYVRDVLACRDQCTGEEDPTIRLGLEVDWFPGGREPLQAALAEHPWDYLIGSVHDVEGFAVDGSPAAWERLGDDDRENLHRRYWGLVKSLAESRLFDIVAHIDLTKKFGYFPQCDLTAEIGAALDAVAGAGMVVELNTAGWYKPCADAYPSLDILEMCRQRGIPATISADAHRADHLLRGFQRGAERLARAGYDRVARFAGRKVRFESLAEAMAGVVDLTEFEQLERLEEIDEF